MSNKKFKVSEKKAKENLENIRAYDNCIEKFCNDKHENYLDSRMPFLRMKKEIMKKIDAKKITAKEAKKKLYKEEVKLIKGKYAEEFRSCQLNSCKSELIKKYDSVTQKDLIAYELDKLKTKYNIQKLI